MKTKLRAKHLSLTAITSAVIVSVIAACGDGGTTQSLDDLEIGTQSSEITGGTKVATADLTKLGVVYLNSGSVFCSGVLITNRWVLTADHCFCDSQVQSPGSISVGLYGNEAATANPDLAALYLARGTRLVRNPQYDVAMVRLDRALPFTTPPLIYTGANGSELVNQTVRTYGFGHNTFTNGVPSGAASAVYQADFRVQSLQNDPGPSICPIGQCNPTECTKRRPGLATVPLAGSTAQTQGGDSGGPVFLGSNTSTRVLVGITSGSINGVDASTGLWLVRDWIRTNATDAWTRSACDNTSIPQSEGARLPALAEGPDLRLHAAALQPNNSIAHFRTDTAGQWTKISVPSTLSAHGPAIGSETPGMANRRLGLAFRDSSTGRLKYARYSPSTGWSTPVNVLNVTTPAGPAMSNTGVIAFIDQATNRIAATAYDAPNNTFVLPQFVPAGAPAVDASKRISIASDPTTTDSAVGYRTSSNQWVSVLGSWNNCFPSTLSYFCAAFPAVGTDWQNATFGYVPGQLLTAVTTRMINGLPMLQNQVVIGSSIFDYGMNRSQVPATDQPAVGAWHQQLFMLKAIPNSMTTPALRIHPADDCFANL